MSDYKSESATAEPKINLVEMIRFLWSRKWHILGSSFLIAVVAAGLTLLIPDVYRANVILIASENDDSLVSQVGGLGGLASLAGISLPSGSRSEEYLAIMKSREFIWSFVDKHDLRKAWFSDRWDADTQSWSTDESDTQPSHWDAYRLFVDDMLRVSTDRRSGLVHVSIDWTDPGLAAKWVNLLVNDLNEHLRVQAIKENEANIQYLSDALRESQVFEMQQTIYQLITRSQRAAMLANTRQEFAFKIVDKAYPPDKKVRPLRAFIVLAMAFLSGVLMCLFFLWRRWVSTSSFAVD